MPRASEWNLAQLAVLDGDDPRTWVLWNEPFTNLKRRCESLQPVLPRALSGTRQLRFEVLVHAYAELLSRTTWTAVVGTLVDGASPSIQQRQRHQDVCRALSESDTALYRTAGYHLLVVNALSPTQEQVEFVRDLTVDAEDILGAKYVQRPHEVFGVETLLAAFRFSQQAANHLSAKRAFQ